MFHWQLVDGKLQTRYKYALSQLQHCEETKGPRFDRRAFAFKAIRNDVTQAILARIAEG